VGLSNHQRGTHLTLLNRRSDLPAESVVMKAVLSLGTSIERPPNDWVSDGVHLADCVTGTRQFRGIESPCLLTARNFPVLSHPLYTYLRRRSMPMCMSQDSQPSVAGPPRSRHLHAFAILADVPRPFTSLAQETDVLSEPWTNGNGREGEEKSGLNKAQKAKC
jgi:hypothetical protein